MKGINSEVEEVMLSSRAMSSGDSSDTQEWLKVETARLDDRLAQALSTADKLALLRSIVRLKGGRMAREDFRWELSNQELEAAFRFGLAINSSTVRLLDERDDRAPQRFWAAHDLDVSLRRHREHLPPDAMLLRHTQHPDYRSEGQKAAVRSLFTMPYGASLMVCLPTGSGKSLLFQLMAAKLREENAGGCVVVITPTVSLALDHERTLSVIPGLEGSRALVGGMAPIERANVVDSFRRGEIPILLMSPEIALGAAREHLVEAATNPTQKLGSLKAHLSAIFIDEAHIIENWGRTFRPDFQRLPGLVQELRDKNRDLRCVLLSATLPPAARAVLRASYQSDRGWAEVDAATPRSEFDIVIQAYDTADARLGALDFVLDRAPRPLIVYTTLAGDEDEDRGPRDLRLSASELYNRLRERGYERIALFSGEVSSNSERNRIVQDWAADRLDIVVATSAFGMGVDKANVRSVIHACLPDSPARWYQEIGRSARDGRQGLAICLFTDAKTDNVIDDTTHARSTAASSWITRDLAVPRWEAMVQSSYNGRWIDDKRAITINLDAIRQGITISTDHNRRWNMSIINLLQRARMVDVVSCTQEANRFAWDVEVREPGLLAYDPVKIWDRVFALRDREQARAREDVRQFINVMRRADKTCVLRDVFELLQDRHTDEILPCGRCPGCRARGEIPALNTPYRVLADAWPADEASKRLKLPPGVTLLVPGDSSLSKHLTSLTDRLAAAGIEQLLAPDDLANACAEALMHSAARLGLIINHSSVIRDPRGITNLPTAVLLRPHEATSKQVLSTVKDWKNAGILPDPLLVVTSPSTELDGRRLDQTLSPRAPYLEDALEHFSIMETIR